MESFKAPEVPFFKRFFNNVLVQLGLLLVVASILGVFIYQRGQENIQQRVTYLKSSIQINSSELNPPPPPPPMVAQNTPTPPPPETTESASKEAPTKAADVKVTPKETRGLAKTLAPHLIVYYAEVPRSVLANIYEASQATGQFMSFKDYTAGILPAVDKRVTNANVKILHREDKPLDSSKTLQWFYGLKDRANPSVEIGLTTFFELNDLDSNNLRGNLEIQRTWREPGATGGFEIQRKSFPAIFEIGVGTGFFISGVMPTQSFLENDDELTSIDIYKILRSPQFRSGDSDFVIFIEFSKSN
ncbi:MAG TPA: hypothetical protein VF412_01695 [Bdellovibrio sp.]|uniref:hypothetical protein n=1 Tax=Bdellovibrio sp. TaxID=28201 RepID=UPI002EF95234